VVFEQLDGNFLLKFYKIYFLDGKDNQIASFWGSCQNALEVAAGLCGCRYERGACYRQSQFHHVSQKGFKCRDIESAKVVQSVFVGRVSRLWNLRGK
jgi:hypothetical protein